MKSNVPACVTKSLPNGLPQIHSHGSNSVWSTIIKTTKAPPPPPLDQSGGRWFWESLEKAKQTQDLTNGLLAHLVLVVTSSLWNAFSLLSVAFLLPLLILPLLGLLHGRTTNMAKALKIILKWLFERTNIINEKKNMPLFEFQDYYFCWKRKSSKSSFCAKIQRPLFGCIQFAAHWQSIQLPVTTVKEI